VAIRQCRHTAIMKVRQPLVSTAQADTCLRRKGLERHTLIEVLADQGLVQASLRVHQPYAE
jgi:hypothetical protein